MTRKWLESFVLRLCTIVQAKLTFLHKPFLYYLTFNFLKVGDASPANIQITQKCLDLFMLCLCMLVWVKFMFVHKPFLSYFVCFCYFIYVIYLLKVKYLKDGLCTNAHFACTIVHKRCTNESKYFYSFSQHMGCQLHTGV